MGAGDKAWFDVDEALQYLGLDPWDPVNEDRLEEYIIDYQIEVEVDDEGNLLEIEPTALREVLFDLHQETVGHRPDDPEEQKKAMANEKRKRTNAAKRRRDRRMKLIRRVSTRRRADGRTSRKR